MMIKTYRMSCCEDALIYQTLVRAVTIEWCLSDVLPRSKRGGVQLLVLHS